MVKSVPEFATIAGLLANMPSQQTPATVKALTATAPSATDNVRECLNLLLHSADQTM